MEYDTLKWHEIFKEVLKDIKATRIIQGRSFKRYFDPKYEMRNIFNISNIYCLTYSIRPSDIYDFYVKPNSLKFPARYSHGDEHKFVDEMWNSYNYYFILDRKKTNYFVNINKMTCSCSFRGNECKHLHYYKDLYNMYFVFVRIFGIILGCDLLHEYYSLCKKRPECQECNKKVTWYSNGKYLCNKCISKARYNEKLLSILQFNIKV